MGCGYIERENSIRDYLLQLVKMNINFDDNSVKEEINKTILNFLENVLEYPEYVIHLDFEIKSDCGYVKVVGKNIISALWLSGLFPLDINSVITSNVYYDYDCKYVYNLKTNELTCNKLYE